MRKIKFRGVRMSDGETIYGYYHVREGDAYIDDWRVKPDSVAQLVGTDNNGEDVYEGDELVESTTGDVVHACFNFMHGDTDGGFTSIPLGGRIHFYTLVK